MQILQYIALTIGVVGAGVIIWGVMMAVIEFVRLEHKRFRGENICRSRELLRNHLGSYLLLGIEFLIAADIIHSIMSPNLEAILLLGVVVAIRTVLGYFLDKELASHTPAETKD
ncbi:hypothetical protein ES703_109541 [subsurface metagenome]|jgi:uncharacterized membrane protein